MLSRQPDAVASTDWSPTNVGRHILLALVLSVAISEGSSAAPPEDAVPMVVAEHRDGAHRGKSTRSKCIVIGGTRVCLEDARGGRDDDDDDDRPPKKKKKGDQATPGERSCPPGYVVLDKANRYGNFCEPREGFPTKTDQAKTDGTQGSQKWTKCENGTVGTPPNCTCPFGSEFFGAKGCMKVCCGTPSTDPKYSKVYVQCHRDQAQALSRAVTLAKVNGDPGNKVTCEYTKNFPPENN
jgi:hypothetical protein